MKIYKTAIRLFALIMAILLLSACSDNRREAENQQLSVPALPSESFEEEFLYEDVPTPKTADVFILSSIEDDEYKRYSFTFENFTLQEAEDYVKLLEDNVVKKREMYDVYTKNDYPILNYIGLLENGNAVLLSQSGTGGAITINVKKSS